MKSKLFLLVCVAVFSATTITRAQVPQMISYQGRVASGTNAFDGTGQFKFALVNGGADQAAPAMGTASVSFGFLVHITVTSGGMGYTAPPSVTITDQTGQGAMATAIVSAGSVVSILVNDAGSGYSSSPTVTIAPPQNSILFTTFWSNDGTGTTGDEPSAHVIVPVSHGLFTIYLGDTAISNMMPIAPTVFTNTDVRLRIWFSDGVNGFQQLSPDQRIAAVGYAMMANNVADASITAAKLADGAISTAKLANDVKAGLSGVVLSEDPHSTNLLAAGYVQSGDSQLSTERWQITFARNAPLGRSDHSVVWTGTEMIMWGGSVIRGGITNDGWRYNPASNRWAAISSQNAPPARARHTAVWTGSKMLVWGGGNASDVSSGIQTNLNSGGIYSADSDSWGAITQNAAPQERQAHTAVWSGSEMIIWGGHVFTNGANGGSSTFLNSGGRYNLASHTWAATSQIAAPGARKGHFATWTGSEMLIWGGLVNDNYSPANDLWRYNPAADAWRAATTVGAPQLSWQASGVWTGSELLVWDSQNGGRYDPVSDTWRTMDNPGPPYSEVSTWSGSEAYALPPQGSSGGWLGRYSPKEDLWTPIATDSGFLIYWGRYFWIGNGLLAFDPYAPSVISRYSPPRLLYLYTRP